MELENNNTDSASDNIHYVLDLVAALFVFFKEKKINITDLEKAEIIVTCALAILKDVKRIDEAILALKYFSLDKIPFNEAISKSFELYIRSTEIRKYYDNSN